MLPNETATAARVWLWAFGLLTAAGYAALAVIHWQHSAAALLHGRAFPDLGDSLKASVRLELAQTVTLAALFALYVLVVIYWRHCAFDVRRVVIISALPCLLATAALPANSTDVLAYVGLGRIVAVHHANPYLHTYSNFTDWFQPLLEWDIPMPYGPVLLPIFALAGRISQWGVLPALFTLKVVWLAVHALNCRLVWSILAASGRDAAFGLFLFALNPLLLLELLANGHNDGVLILFVLLALRALQRVQLVAAVVLAFTAGLVKLPGLLVWLVILVWLARRKAWRSLAVGLLTSAALLIALKLTFWPTRAALLSLLNTGSYAQNSIHKLLIVWAEAINHWVGSALHFDHFYFVDRLLCAPAFLALVLWRLQKVRAAEDVMRESAMLLLALLIGYATWFFPWYVTWLVPLAALTDSTRSRWTILAFSWSALAIYAFPKVFITEASLHGLWATARVVMVHITPLLIWLWSHRWKAITKRTLQGET